MPKNKPDQGDISTPEALEEDEAAAIAAALADKEEALREDGPPPPAAPTASAKSKAKPTAIDPDITVTTKAMRANGKFRPQFFQVQGESEEAGSQICVVFDITRDILPSNVSGSTAIRQQSFSYQDGYEDTGDGTQKATFKTLTLKIGANFINADIWNACCEYFAEERTFMERIDKRIIYAIKPKNEVNKITNLNEFADGDAIAIITQTFDIEMLKDWQRATKSAQVSKEIAQQIKVLKETVNNIAQKKRSMASA